MVRMLVTGQVGMQSIRGERFEKSAMLKGENKLWENNTETLPINIGFSNFFPKPYHATNCNVKDVYPEPITVL